MCYNRVKINRITTALNDLENVAKGQGFTVGTDDAGQNTVNHIILKALAEVRQESYEALVYDMGRDDGDLNITAKEQPAVIAILEDHLECGPLLEPQDLGKDKKQANSCLCPITGTSVKQLGEAVLSKISSHK